jgi:hypothetical protein
MPQKNVRVVKVTKRKEALFNLRTLKAPRVVLLNMGLLSDANKATVSRVTVSSQVR